ncbi:oxygenase MpaB family protein [Microbacterium sp. CPCC 204701]|uniref:oxygenase MpaB family protein n=1 Tax=Microbacterium sp. CPCC 204701 TaxID=2493084 RepID=UPI000FD9CC48|nr:oxygenase MpaB family protein [Microbacterium sp. CPCC 204701]
MKLRARLLIALSGDPDGAPPWVRELAQGDDRGWFAEDGPAWTVHAGMGTMVAGIRALLLQALHPGALAGVHDWSRYREDPIGRLTGTVRWVICLTYGSRAQAQRETARVGRFHERVSGTYRATDGTEVTYSAADADLVEWVHLAFTDAFLTCHEAWGGPIPGGPDAYVAEWATAGRLMRVSDPPRTEAELRRRLDAHLEAGVLRRDERVDDVVRFLGRPPFRDSRSMSLAYRVLFASAVATIPRRYRELLGLRRTWLPVVTLTRGILAVTGRTLSGGPRAQDFARRRLRRLEQADAAARGSA